MQARRSAVILPLDMLVNVNIEPLLQGLARQVKQKNKKFELTKQIRDTVLELAVKFARGRIEKKDFATKVLTLFGLQGKKRKHFWIKWGETLDTGNLKAGIELLQQYSRDHNVLFHIYGEMNAAHFDKLLTDARSLGLHVQEPDLLVHAAAQPTLAGMPLCLSFQQKAVRSSLVDKQVKALGKKLKEYDAVTLLADDPQNFNLEDVDQYLPGDPILYFYKKLKEIALIDASRFSTICQLTGIQLYLHSGNLQHALSQLFDEVKPENQVTKQVGFNV